MYNPFIEINKDEDDDSVLINASLAGDRIALEKLILRHQAWIYNIAIKMVMDPDDACDVTQEILIKIITRLSSYRHEIANFRTWLYRIVANHVLTMKKREYEIRRNYSMDEFFSCTEKIPDDRSYSHPDFNVIFEEAKINCMTGMLLCFNRNERLVFILGDIFNVTDSVGSEIMEISKANFRQILSRSRRKLFNHMYKTCNCLNEEAPCICRNKMTSLKEMGIFDPDRRIYYREDAKRIGEVIGDRVNEFMDFYHTQFLRLFREHPFYDEPVVAEWVSEMLKKEDFQKIFNL